MELVKLPTSPNAVTEPTWVNHLKDATDQKLASDLWHSVIAEIREAKTLATVNGGEIKRYCLMSGVFDRMFDVIEAEGAVIRNCKKARTHSPSWSVLKDCDAIRSGRSLASLIRG